MLPDPGEVRLATGLILALALIFLMAIPFASAPAGRLAAFMPAYEASLLICDVITAVLLIGLSASVRSAAVLVLGAGYLFDAAMIVAHAASFPGLFSETGLFGAGSQTTIWLYVFWHAGFPAFVLGYLALRRREEGSAGGLGPRPGTVAAVAGSALLAGVGLGVVAFAAEGWLPRMIAGNDHLRLLTTGVSPVVWLLSLLAFAWSWRGRRRSILDLWLTVVMAAWVMDVGLAIVVGSARFDWGFYLSRTYGLLAATAVLGALLLEMVRLYQRLGSALELAERRNAELIRSREDLAAAQRLETIGSLAGNVAHDFNNLLTAVLGSLELLEKRWRPPDERASRLLENAVRGAQKGATLTQRLLAFGRRQTLTSRAVDLGALVEGLSELLRSSLGTGVALVTEIPEDVPPVWADANQLEMALLNLAVNAHDAMRGQGRFTIAVRAEHVGAGQVGAGQVSLLGAGDYVVLSAADTGEGMDEATLARATEPFFTTKGLGKGTGLGLSMVQGFAAQSGGTLALRSRKGEGTVAELWLPRARPAEPGQAPRTLDTMRATSAPA